ncbi:5'-3' exoribonuclease 2-like isoform X2 [Asterias rubens]|uniref:5'-3' exoribonuclease 2-like isoform X2 n=1 Tax=Asterias rubens TaxID=7604 RepID=UPI0014553465|nr:5'-3' exoribonuclease 2-like isoform X2 [Asterias rubens]
MGVPAFFRWLSKKYPSIVVHAVEEKPKEVNGVTIPMDISTPNPNDAEFDNLYLDMNGIIHPCCHPENKPAPKDEDEMMVDIFAYIDRLMRIIRPRRMLYMAIDGVAPRAKMNQQRSRRFRASKEAIEKKADIARIREEVFSRGGYLPPPKPSQQHFDSNCITPGTEFMARLAECLRYYVTDRLNNHPGWQNLKVLLSDANVPGEGEHKIMDYIRRQRGNPDHDPNTHHCLCGADADLIMLGLATHEPYFTIIREEFKPNTRRPCELCNQVGHDLKECTGAPKEAQEELDSQPAPMGEETQFIFLRLNILREYLEKELWMTGLPFTFDLERAIDDWVFMCFFVGNDFLPHLPSLEIREGAIDRLQKLYKKAVYKTGGYLTDSGMVNLDRVQLIMTDLGEAEDEIFKQRRQNELRFRKNQKERNKRMKMDHGFKRGGLLAPQAISRNFTPASAREIKDARDNSTYSQQQNKYAADALKASFVASGSSGNQNRAGLGMKRPHEGEEEDEYEKLDKTDSVKLWEDGWKERYYEGKFDVLATDRQFCHKVAEAYILGMCWVLRYYYQGCPSWNWYYPYHYAPFASDFLDVAKMPHDFETGTKPFKPLEQLMSVFPAASGNFIPATWRELMSDIDSPIIDCYPTNFKIDLNGKKYAWQGVALLPFVDEKRLLETVAKVYCDLTEAERKRNSLGPDRLYVHKSNPLFAFFKELYDTDALDKDTTNVDLDSTLDHGVRGNIGYDEYVCFQGGTKKSSVPSLPDLEKNNVLSVSYKDPQYPPGHVFPATKLPGAEHPAKVLKPEDFNQNNRGRGRGYRPQLGFQRGSGYRGGNFSSASADRTVSIYNEVEMMKWQIGSWLPDLAPIAALQHPPTIHSLPPWCRHNLPNQYANIPPPQTGYGGGRYGGRQQGGRGGGGYNQQQYGQQKQSYNQGNQGSYYQNRGDSRSGYSGHQGQQQSGHGGTGWSRSNQGQQNAYQQNQDRYQRQQQPQGYGNSGRHSQGYQQSSSRSYPPPPSGNQRRY